MRVTCVWVVAFACCLAGCESWLGKRIVSPPNQGKALTQLELDEPAVLPDAVIDHRLRVEVDGGGTGAGPASLSLWVIDPSDEVFLGTLPNPKSPRKVRPVFARTHDGPRVTRPARGTVLLLHGYYDEKNQGRYLTWGRILAAAGYRAVLIDQRGHGRSTGDWATYGVAEAADMAAVLDALQQRGLVVGDVGVMAVSFGASTAVRWASADDRVRALVLVSGFASMRSVVEDFGRAIGFRSFSHEKFQRIIDHAGRAAGFDPDDADAEAVIDRVAVPTLIFHGEEDRLIPIDHAVRLYAAAGREDVELVRVASAGHTDLGDALVEPIREPMLGWFARHLR
ncbi:MAG: alpha/beta fold hydrolase [Planctomycetota bacterium]